MQYESVCLEHMQHTCVDTMGIRITKKEINSGVAGPPSERSRDATVWSNHTTSSGAFSNPCNFRDPPSDFAQLKIKKKEALYKVHCTKSTVIMALVLLFADLYSILC